MPRLNAALEKIGLINRPNILRDVPRSSVGQRGLMSMGVETPKESPTLRKSSNLLKAKPPRRIESAAYLCLKMFPKKSKK